MRAAVLAAALASAAAVAIAGALQFLGRERMLRSILGARDLARHTSNGRGDGSAKRWGRAFALVLLAVGVMYVIAGVPGAAVAAIVGASAPRFLRHRRVARHNEALEAQLVNAVSALSAALRAGLSLSQSVRYAESEASSPLAEELRDLIEAEELGIPLNVSLDHWERSAESPDLRLLASVLRMKIGAGLPAVLDQVGASLRSRQSARKELRSLTAQSRLSGFILSLLPVGFFLFLSATSRSEMAAAYGTGAGIAAIVSGLILQAGAFVWIRRLVEVEPA